jgi:hypothetical protein
MKRYNINWYNGWKIMIDLVYIPLLIICVPFVWTIICVWWLIFSDNMAIPTLGCTILAVAVIAITLYFGLANRFYYDEKNEEIILKLIHQQPRRIPIRNIALVSRKVNANKNKGPVTHYGKNDAQYKADGHSKHCQHYCNRQALSDQLAIAECFFKTLRRNKISHG